MRNINTFIERDNCNIDIREGSETIIKMLGPYLKQILKVASKAGVEETLDIIRQYLLDKIEEA